MDKLSIIQWNCQSISGKTGELIKYLDKQKRYPDILLLQETYLKSTNTFKLKGYNIERLDRSHLKAAGGITTCIKEGIPYLRHQDQLGIESMRISISIKGGILQVINVYLSPSIKFSSDELSPLFSFDNCIVGGDFNAYANTFGADRSSNLGIGAKD
ncbi:endonuclease/exonuclease/phosphatase family protein [Staphylococcus aureus]